MKIFLTEFTEQRLIEIYLYYAEHASDKVAERLLKNIFDKISSLQTAPLIGSPDE